MNHVGKKSHVKTNESCSEVNESCENESYQNESCESDSCKNESCDYSHVKVM